MPMLQGEERVLTTYADVHYYFTTPSILPRQHRFDKDSYLYLYLDAAQHRSRIEIANNPGTAEIDAVYGSLQSIRLSNSDRFPTRCTLTVDGTGPPATPVENDGEWRLTYISPHDGGRAFLRVHTLDIYFWTVNDVKQFLGTMQRLVPPGQLDIMPLNTREPSLSSVVQQLENVAVSDPSYRNSQMRTPGADSINVSPLPPPPAGPPTQPPALSTNIPANQHQHQHRASEPVSPLDDEHSTPPASKPPETTQSYAPLGYNPASPPAPEPVKHREKTPPPPDAVGGTGLAAAASAHAHGAPQFTAPPQGHAPEYGGHIHSSPGGVQHPYTSSAPYIGVSQHGQHPHAPPSGLSFAPPPTSPPANAPSAAPGRPGSLTFASPPPDPNLHLYRQQTFPTQPAPGQYSGPQHSPALANVTPAQPLGYGQQQQYSYGHPHQQHPHPHPGANPYDIHNQLYRATDVENSADLHGNAIHPPQGHPAQPGQQVPPGGQQRPGKITENAMRVEKGMNRFLKKLEKKF